ncbi:autotransporter outer membrane beta-barrel domain-containing protein [uncultured Megasphaera sp.]|uniref:autotransporter outer membrane beta-barrel domain-containing protein n=1 Tax=uncultured Megasphaera sp. TaxID=165188 RepID=UPI0025DD8826|nr:autotransporter outer membrane beta-barrel domain-containing protein [uncultured Megasphaera sp.]
MFKLNGEQKVTATGDVSVLSEMNYDIQDPVYIFDGNETEGDETEGSETKGKLDLNMNSHSLTIDSGSDSEIFFINQSDTQVNIHDADTIEVTARFGAIVNAYEQSGNSISLQANKDIRLIQADGSWDSSLGVAGDNQLNLNAGHDILLQNDLSESLMSIGGEAKATLEAGNDIALNKGDITSWGGGFLEMEAGNDITFNEADINVWRKGELQMKAGNDIKVNGEGVAGMDLNGGGILQMEAGQITFDKADIEAKEEATLEMNSDKGITFDNAGIDLQSGAKIKLDAGNDIKLDNTSVNVQDKANVEMNSGHKIIFNKTNAESDSPNLYIDAGSNAMLTAKNDIIFNRVQDGTFIELNYTNLTPRKGAATATITAEEGNIIFHEDQASNSSAINLKNGANLQMEAQTIKGDMQRFVYMDGYDYLSLKANDIEWVAQGQEVEDNEWAYNTDDTSMIFAKRGEVDFDVTSTLRLSSEVTPTLIHTYEGGYVTIKAGDSIYLHNVGNDPGSTDYYNEDYAYYYDDAHKYQANLWAIYGKIDLTTTDGKISIDNKGSIAALAEYGGEIDFNGNTIIPEAGIGAKSENGGKINFKVGTVMSNVGIGVWAQTDNEPWYRDDESSEIDFNGTQRLDQAESRSFAKLTNDSLAVRQAYDDDLDETDDEPGYEDDYDELSKITFDGPLTIVQAETGAVAKLNSDIVFNDALNIQAEGDAFYTKWAGRIQALASGVDKVIIGNMRAYNGQIDVLFDTPDSSFTGFTELREIHKGYSYKEDSEDNDGTCPLEPGPGDCGGVEYPDEEIVDESTCPAEPGDCGGGVDYGGCEEPVVDEVSHINITLRNGAFWDVTGDSTLTTLDNDSLVNMTDGTRSGTSITAKNLSGTGTIHMDLDWTSNGGAKEKTEQSDYIVATESATGTQAIVSDPATMHLDAMGIDDRLYFATLTNSDAVFTSPITQQNVTKGSLYDYTIGITSETITTTDAADTMADRAAADTTTDWFFGTVGYTESPVVETGRINSNIVYDLATDVDTLNKRMGDVRNMNTDPDGWWARTTYTHQGRDSYSGHSNRFELGKDFVTSRDDGNVVHQGAVFTYLRSSDSFDNGNGKYKRYSGALYHTWLGNNGQYVDVVGRMGKVMGNSHTFLVNGDQSDSSFGTWYQQASVETGKTYDLEDNWYFEPQAQLQYTHMNSKSYTSSDGINHDLDSVNSFIGRLGFRLGQRINDKTAWYVKGDILHEFSGDGGIMLTSANGLERIDYNRDGKDTWYDLGVGLTAELSPASSLWFEFERKFSGSYSNNWEFNGGISWKF